MSVEETGRMHFQLTNQLTKNYLTCQNVIPSLVRGPRVIFLWTGEESVTAAHNKRGNFRI
jgi:hypothetical protein